MRTYVVTYTAALAQHGGSPRPSRAPWWPRCATRASRAWRRGAELRLGGRPVPGRGSFYPPTLLTGVPEDALITRREFFGPVAAIAAYDDEASMVAAANATSAGLVAFVYTRDLDRAVRVGAGSTYGEIPTIAVMIPRRVSQLPSWWRCRSARSLAWWSRTLRRSVGSFTTVSVDGDGPGRSGGVAPFLRRDLAVVRGL
ncbi:aldehyde dehydrogenase family protein [Actinomadura alba]|uniref:Aldehyde dehydrogenase family protein n=1 Tax=Actinomadura alba TaxID=406431 RepID=A0ABR7LJA6_9ACTN|nr:aldehyde dehydrogenase family protein [Actinomadura alba]